MAPTEETPSGEARTNRLAKALHMQDLRRASRRGVLPPLSDGALPKRPAPSTPNDVIELIQQGQHDVMSLAWFNAELQRKFGDDKRLRLYAAEQVGAWVLGTIFSFVATACIGFKIYATHDSWVDFLVAGVALGAGIVGMLHSFCNASWWFTSRARWIYGRRVIVEHFCFEPALTIYARHEGTEFVLPAEPKLYGYSQSRHSVRNK